MMSAALDSAAKSAWKAYQTASAASGGFAGVLLSAAEGNKSSGFDDAFSTFTSAAAAAAEDDLPAATVAQASDLQAATYSESQVYTALQTVDSWSKKLGIENYLTGSEGADGWKSAYDNDHQSIFGQIGSALGSAVGGVISGVGNVLGGQGNAIGQALDSAGSWTAAAGSLIGNDPLQAAADAAEAAPGAVLSYALAVPLAITAAVGLGTQAVGQATGNKGLASAGSSLLGGEGAGINSALTNPVASSEILGGVVAGALGAIPVAGALLGAGIGGLVGQTAQALSPPPPPKPKSSKAPLWLGLGAAGAGIGLLAVLL
jgi:hypothetical protein